MPKLLAILESLSDDTKKSIMEWGDVLSDNNFDDDNVNHYGDPLLIIEWNEAGLAQRNIQKATILNLIRSFQGCMPFPNVDRPRSDSLFQVVNRP
ncbi:35120_t:CDS:2, partial [Gigaspora margarita]